MTRRVERGATFSDGWWGRGRIALAVSAAALAGAAAFLYRFNTLGGALGGFENDHFMYLVRTDMLLWGRQPLRDFADWELRGAWPALSYAASAWAQQLGGRTLLPEAYLTAGALAAAYALVFVLALDLSRRWAVAALAVAAAVATAPKLYNYPKVLMLALAVWAIRAIAVTPSSNRLVIAALVTGAATLFRHDYGVYVGVAIMAALIARRSGGWSGVTRAAAVYAGATAAWLLPSAIWVQLHAGIPEYVRNTLASVAAETARTELKLPAFDPTAPFTGDSLLVATFVAYWALPAVVAVVVLWWVASPRAPRLPPAELATAAGLVAMTITVDHYFLRANLAERFGDAVVPFVLLGAWLAGSAGAWRSPRARAVLATVPMLLLLQVAAAAYSFAHAARELDTSGLSDSWAKVSRRYTAVRDELGGLPPVAWPAEAELGSDSRGVMRVARYVAGCTAPDDHVLVTGSINEVSVFARRPFAGGQAIFKSSLYTAEADQQRVVGRLQQQSVPIVVADAADFDEGFLTDYPVVAQYVAAHYREAGVIAAADEPRYVILAAADRAVVRLDPHLGLPCFQ